MNIFIVPIEHFVLDGIKKLDKYILMPVDFVLMGEYSLDLCLSNKDKEVIEYIKTKQVDILVDCSGLEFCTLVVCEVKNTDGTTDKELQRICFEIEKALDYIAITQYRFDRKEWTIGVPGAMAYVKMGFSINCVTDEVCAHIVNTHSFCEIPGIGLEVSFGTLKNMDEQLYEALFSERKDEVYRVCRNYIARACRAFYIMDLNEIFSHLFSVLEGIGMVGSPNFLRFTSENERIMAFIASSQSEYEQRLDEFCYYSETLRTLIVHDGKDILELMDIKSAFRVLTTIFWVIIRYALALIELNITDFDKLEEKINKRKDKFEKHTSHLETFILKQETFNCEGGRDIFIVPIDNFESEELLVFKNMLIVPRGYCGDNSGLNQSDITECVYERIMSNEDVLRLNEDMALVLYKGAYKLDNIDLSETAWQYLDDICAKIKNELVFLYLDYRMKEERDGLFGAVGIHNGIRVGMLYDNAFNKFYTLMGRVYSLYNNTETPYTYDAQRVEKWVYKATLGNVRKDVIALECKAAIQNVGKAIYADDINYSFMYLFEAIEQLCTYKFNIAFKWKWIAGFLMNKRSNYDKVHDRLVEIGDKYRTPIFHYGKNIYEIVSTDDEIYSLFEEIKNIVLKYCKEVLSTGIESYEDLNMERINRMNAR